MEKIFGEMRETFLGGKGKEERERRRDEWAAGTRLISRCCCPWNRRAISRKMQAATLPSPLPTVDVNCHEINDSSAPVRAGLCVSISCSYQRGPGSIHTSTVVAKTEWILSEMSSVTALCLSAAEWILVSERGATSAKNGSKSCLTWTVSRLQSPDWKIYKSTACTRWIPVLSLRSPTEATSQRQCHHEQEHSWNENITEFWSIGATFYSWCGTACQQKIK
jgi:hypothetical protein